MYKLPLGGQMCLLLSRGLRQTYWGRQSWVHGAGAIGVVGCVAVCANLASAFMRRDRSDLETNFISANCCCSSATLSIVEGLASGGGEFGELRLLI